MLELGAAVTAVAYTLSSHRLGRRYRPWSLTALQLGAGTLFFLPGLVFLLRDGWPGSAPGTVPPWALTGVLVFLGGFVTLGAFGCYNWGLSRLPATQASLFLNLTPVVAVLLGWVLLGESLTTGQLLSAAAVVGGVLLGQGLGRRRHP